MVVQNETAVELLIADRDGRVLVEAAGPPVLPQLVFPGPHAPMDHRLTAAVAAEWGIETSILRPLWYSRMALECRRPDVPPRLRWAEREELAPEIWHDAGHAVTTGAERRPNWYQPGWMDRAEEWTDRELHRIHARRSGDLVQIKHWSQSAVLRVPTAANDDLYFKMVIPALAGEPDRLAVLSSKFADRVPEVVAADEEQIRWLTRDFGGVSGWDLGVDRTSCLAAFAELQLGFVDDCAALTSAGYPLRTYDGIAAAIDPLLARDDLWQNPALPRALSEPERDRLRTLGPELAARCAELESGPISHTLTHGDLEPLNVVRTAQGWVVHDWTFAAIAHPFFDLACWISDCDETEAPLAVGRYLDEWRAFATRTELERQWMIAKPVGGFCELLKFADLCDAIEPDQRFSWTPMLFGWARRLIRLFEPKAEPMAGW